VWIIETEEPTTSLLLDEDPSSVPDPALDERAVPDLDVYADALLLVDALERHEVEALEDVETGTLIDLYTFALGCPTGCRRSPQGNC